MKQLLIKEIRAGILAKIKSGVLARIKVGMQISALLCTVLNTAIYGMSWQDGLVHTVQELSLEDVSDMIYGIKEEEINRPDSHGRYALHEAVKLDSKDSVERVRLLLKWHANPEVEQDGKTALQIAVDEGTAANRAEEKIRALLCHYYLHWHRRFDKPGSTLGRNVLPSIASKGVYGAAFQGIVAQERKRKGEQETVRRRKLAGDLYLAVTQDRDLVKIESLLAQGANPHSTHARYQQRDAVYDALYDNDSRSVAALELLVRKGCKLERLYGSGNCLYQPFKLLLQSRTNLSREDKVAKFKLLLDAGVDIDFALMRRMKNGFETKGGDSEYSQLEQLFKAAVAQGRSWRQLFPGVAQEFLPEVCIPIVGEYAYPYYGDEYNYDTPELDKHNPKKLAHYLMEATQEYDLEKMEQLLDLGADPYYPRRGMHRLYEALRDGRKQSVSVVQLLVRKGFDVNRECRGEQALNVLKYACLDIQNRKAKLEALEKAGLAKKKLRLRYDPEDGQESKMQ